MQLFGHIPAAEEIWLARIMVTMGSEAAKDPSIIQPLVEAATTPQDA